MRKKLGGLVLALALGLGLCSARGQTDPSTQCIASAYAGGTSDAITIPALPCALTTNLLILSVVTSNTTTTPTLQPLGLSAQTIVRANGMALFPGDMIAGGKALLNPTGSQWVLMNPQNLTASTITISPLTYGAKCDGTTDDSAAMTLWAAAVTANSHATVPGTCAFKSPLVFPQVNGVLLDGGGVLKYTGTTTTGTIVQIGASAAACSVHDWKVNDLQIVSSTTMTAGIGLLVQDLCASDFKNLTVGGFNSGNGDSHWFNGVEFLGGNTINVRSGVFSAGGGTAEIVAGDINPIVDFSQVQGLVFASSVGIDYAGGVYGAFLDEVNILENGANVKISQDVDHTANAQIFIGSSTAIDITANVSYPSGSQIGIEISDVGASSSYLTFTGWLASSYKQCLKIDSGVTTFRVNLAGGEVLNCGLAGAASINGYVDNESAASGVSVSLQGTHFFLASSNKYVYNNPSAPTPINLAGVRFETNATGYYSSNVAGNYTEDGGTTDVAGPFVVTDSASTHSIQVNGSANSSGASLELIGNGGTTPNKYLRSQGGAFAIVNSGYSSAIMTLTDAGVLNAATGYQTGGTAGVTCSGAPTGSFASTGGIVTHC